MATPPLAIPGLNRQQTPVDPSAPIAGVGGIAPVAPPVNQVAPPTAPTLAPVNTMAPQHIGVGGRILSGLGGMFLGPEVTSLIPGTTQHQAAMQAQGLMLRPPASKPTTGSRVARGIVGAFGGGRGSE